MTQLEVFDPPMCCTSGVCGPEVDPLLAAFAADVDWLTSQGVTVVRHNLAQEPHAFVTNRVVHEALQRDGDACLPLLLVDGIVAARGSYPRRDELARLVGLTAAVSRSKPVIRLGASGCCGPRSGCC